METHGLVFDDKDKSFYLKLLYVDITGDLIAGILLSQIIYWYTPAKNGKSKLRVIKQGEEWLAKRRSDWFDECRISRSQYDRAIKILKNLNIVKQKYSNLMETRQFTLP